MSHVAASSRRGAIPALASPVALFFVLLLATLRSFAGELTLAWDPVSSPAVAGYKVHYGPAAGNYTSSVDAGKSATATVGNLAEGATYHFAVTAYDTAGNSSAFSNDVAGTVPHGAPVADFEASTTSGVAPLAMNFINESTGSITGYLWTFGDGTTSTAKNPSKVYSNPGTYTVSLKVTGPGGSNTKTLSGYIKVSSSTSAPVAAFSGSPTSGTAPLTVKFTSASTGSITSYLWTFGDGTTSTAQNPSKVYNTPGTYTVSLKVTGPGGSNTKTSTGLVTVSAKPVGGGVLAGGVVSIFGTVDLSAGGKADWVHWPSNAHKATGGSQIGKYTMIGTKGATTYTGTRALTWRDGTPSATGSSKQGVSTSGAGNGFQVRAPADTQARMLTVYATLVNTAGKLSVRLSDGSAPEYVTLVRQPAWRASGRYDMAFLISYRAASAGQSVTVTWTQNGKAGNGSVGLQGATLATTGQ